MDSLFNLPFIQNASGPLGYFISAVALTVLIYDCYSKWAAARKRTNDAGGKAHVDRFEVISEAEARLQEAYESRDADMRKQLKELREENEVLRDELDKTKDTLAEAQRELRTAQKSILELQTKLADIMVSVEKSSSNPDAGCGRI